MLPPPILHTPRLILRPHRLADFDAYWRMWSDPGVVRFLGGMPFTREQSWMRFLRHAGMWHYMGFGFFVLESREDGSFLGEAGFHEARRDVQPPLEGTLEAGWVLAPHAQGKGLAEEAMRAVVSWGDATFPDRLMTCIIQHDHAASLRVAGKLGFRPATRTRYDGREMIILHRDESDAGPDIGDAS
jgi:RimJ/RimL family protein N-acetyltransferase